MKKKLLSFILVLVCIITSLPITKASAAITAKDNYTQATAYRFSSWSTINTASAILPTGNDESWYKFTLSAGEHIYIRTSTRTTYVGMQVELMNSSGIEINTQNNPSDIIDPTGISPGLYTNVDNETSTTQTYYLKVSRGNYTGNMYFGFNAYNRIRTGTASFSFSGLATNAGNTAYSRSGVDSSVISINLANSSLIPSNAIVKTVTTSGTQSPNQGNVHHKIMPSSNGIWYTSTVTSASGGSYSLPEGLSAKQTWNFKYNVISNAKSTMRKVSIMIYWQYDLKDTNYQIFTSN